MIETLETELLRLSITQDDILSAIIYPLYISFSKAYKTKFKNARLAQLAHDLAFLSNYIEDSNDFVTVLLENVKKCASDDVILVFYWLKRTYSDQLFHISILERELYEILIQGFNPRFNELTYLVKPFAKALKKAGLITSKAQIIQQLVFVFLNRKRNVNMVDYGSYITLLLEYDSELLHFCAKWYRTQLDDNLAHEFDSFFDMLCPTAS